ncbi:family 43 glycosylhydrolase [Reinekea sp. G2M2-21]|uniref:glycoside hydrolase family 43 protein n=1 Tax=Reinekea sp. G2M2-21 TaxID=2788942 RepID=UPI0018A9DD26|nr:glycoside hydrolase family 43 protein [Reinekea sp. G2M2-21]
MTIQNPVIECRADPHIYLHSDGYYYFTASVPEYDRIELRRARSIEALNNTPELVTVWTKPDSGPYSDLIWAPEIHFMDTHWVIYFAAAPNREVKDDAFQHRMYALLCYDDNPLASSWVFGGQVDSGIDSFCLDATIFKLRDQWYYLWAQKSPDRPGNSCLYIATMASATKLSSPPVMLSAPEYDWEVQGFLVNEGPSVIHRYGKIFVTYSASATDERYCMGLLSIDEDSDPLDAGQWHKASEPVFQTDEQRKIYGPGHNSFTRSQDGQTDYLVYHARNYKNIEGDPLWDPNRHTCVQVLRWNEQGEPVFGRPQQQIELHASDICDVVL